MSLIKCPECKKKISDTVISCPKCGFSIADNLDAINSSEICRKNIKRRIIVLSLIIIVILSTILVTYNIYNHSQADTVEETDEIKGLERKRKYPLSKQNVLTMVNDILGKDSSEILDGYTEGEDYTISKNEDYTYFTFSKSDYDLILHTDSSSKITKVQYSFRIDDNRGNFQFYVDSTNPISRVDATEYYDVDPVYTYLDANNNHIKTTQDDFLYSRDKKTTYYITWESTKGKAVYSLTNLYEEKKEYTNWIFTKK